ncbi:hypothetical protein L7F22_002005 [Adiantum nelumboides]|nr:hypothetical protein [Adiantum nelumboides]
MWCKKYGKTSSTVKIKNFSRGYTHGPSECRAEFPACIPEVQDELEKVNEEASDKRIPDFWLTAFLSHCALSEILIDNDQKVFKSLQALETDEYPDVKSGYSITFTFRPNPYFENSFLANWDEEISTRGEIADIILEDLWSNPLKYFHNGQGEGEDDGDEDE